MQIGDELEDFCHYDSHPTAITRMVNVAIPPIEIMKASGYTHLTAFARYLNLSAQTVTRIADLLSNHNAEAIDMDEGLEDQFVHLGIFIPTRDISTQFLIIVRLCLRLRAWISASFRIYAGLRPLPCEFAQLGIERAFVRESCTPKFGQVA